MIHQLSTAYEQFSTSISLPYPIKASIGSLLVLDKQLGKGTYATVCLGYDTLQKTYVAVKQLHIPPSQSNIEAECLLQLNSPFITAMHGHWSQSQSHFLVLELCDGTLRDKMRDCSSTQALCWIHQIIMGLDLLNTYHILHRDLKPQNILLKSGVAKLADFGLAKVLAGEGLGVQSMRCGTPSTMAPEIYFAPEGTRPVYTHKCDIWSLGVIMHELLYKKHPYDYKRDSFRLDTRVPVEKRYGILDSLIDRALNHNVDKRIDWTEFMILYNSTRLSRDSPNSLPRTLKRSLRFAPRFRQEQSKPIANEPPLKNQLVKIPATRNYGRASRRVSLVAGPYEVDNPPQDIDLQGINPEEQESKARHMKPSLQQPHKQLDKEGPCISWKRLFTEIAVLGMVVAGSILAIMR